MWPPAVPGAVLDITAAHRHHLARFWPNAHPISRAPFPTAAGRRGPCAAAARAAERRAAPRFLNVNNELSHKYEKHLPARSSSLNAFDGKMTERAGREPSAEQRRARLERKVSSPRGLAR